MVGDILQPTHLLFVLVVALLVLGPKRLPEVGRALGNGLRDFKAAIDGQSHDDHHDKLNDAHGYDAPDDARHEFAAYTEPAPDDKHEFAYEGSEAPPEPVTSEPDTSEQVAPQPAAPEPVATAPVAPEPAASQPAAAKPAPAQPAAPLD